ncbi:hypothetical protein D0863_04519 [Hortaea werneckii]|uniref:Major facilitator superfamily (MFS) profile domain-containing protein n=1 Tax=Hortaea werneckii TaxID=91943 RepID=A0A3M7E7F8_HORWE|nr:hypothetical protein D0863_04519 [Hortaea werneckii]
MPGYPIMSDKAGMAYVGDVEDGIKPVTDDPVMGTTKIEGGDDVILVPAPSADPRDPLNLPKWRKALFVVLTSICKYRGLQTFGLSITQGLGGLLTFYLPEYSEAGATYADITALMTYPTMIGGRFMGVGNLICMPIALAVGRRPLYLFSLALLIASSVLAAYAKDYNWHLGARMAMGLATSVGAVLILCASPIAGAVGPGDWYNLGAALSAATLLFSIPFVPESRYERSLQAFVQAQVSSGTKDEEEYGPVRLPERPALGLTKYKPRTLWPDMSIKTGKTDVWEGIYCVRNTFQILLFPNVLWAFCLNGLTIGTNESIGTTFGTVMTSVYGWPDCSSSYVNAGQIVVAIVGLPILGYGSDKLITWKASRNNGVHEPESRLMLLGLPLSVGVLGAVIYGQAAAYPEKLHWFAIVAAIAMYYFAFVGAVYEEYCWLIKVDNPGNIAAITYLLDSYPARVGPCLIVITAFRGFVSFGVS